MKLLNDPIKNKIARLHFFIDIPEPRNQVSILPPLQDHDISWFPKHFQEIQE